MLEAMKLEGLKYAKVLEYVPALQELEDVKVLVPVDHLLKDEQYQLADWRIKKMIKQTQSTDEFWELAKEKYGIIPEPDEYKYPSFYVVKLNLGWNTMIFFKRKEILKIVSGARKFACEHENLVKWKKHSLKQYKKTIPAKFFIEEFIGFNLKVYEVYCIYGKPIVLSVYYETDLCYENNYLIIDEVGTDTVTGDEKRIFDTKLLEDEHLFPEANPLNFKVDEKVCEQICGYAKEFAQYFEFMRVDFYYSKGDIYFSECTFKPGALKKIRWNNIGMILSKAWGKKI
jgi:hypothetical protein